MRFLSFFILLFLLPINVFAQLAGKVLSVQGEVQTRQPQPPANWVPARVDQELSEGSQIQTGTRSRAAVLLVDETQLKLGPSSLLELKAARPSSNLLQRVGRVAAGSDQSILNLAGGKAWLRSKKTPANVAVETPAVTAAIRGTEFVLEVASDGESVMTVVEGSVAMQNDFGAIVVNRGERGSARVGQAPTKTVILNPEDAVQWTLYFSAAVSPRDYPFIARTQEEATRVLTSGIDDPLRRAKLQYDRGDIEAALASVQQAAGPEAAEVRGWILLTQNRVDEAVQAFEAAPGQPRSRLGLSILRYREGDSESAYRLVEDPGDDPLLKLQRATLDLIWGDVESARPALESVPPSDPNFALVQGLLSNLELIQNRKDAALEAAQRAVQSAPESPSAYLSLGLAQQSFFDLPAATRSAEMALQLDPSFLQAEILYARLLFGAGRSAEAEDLVRAALERAPDDATAQSLLGFILLGQAKTEEAVQRFRRSVNLDTTRGEPHLGLGIAYLRQGEPTAATTEILTATTLEPRLSLYQSYLAKAFYEERKFEQAFTAISEAIDLDPRDPTPHLYSGIFQNDLNRPGIAVGDFEESIRLNDNRAVYRSRFVLDGDLATRNVQLATAYNRLGLSEWANAAAVRSNAADTSSSSAHLFLAGTFLNLRGRTGAAGSELLVARLLLPVNTNSFNAFNDYTTLFERPRVNFTLGGSYASFDTVEGTVVSTGGASRWAYSSVFQYDRTGGFRDARLESDPSQTFYANDDSRGFTTVNFFKFALTPKSDVLVSLSHFQRKSGDPTGGIVTDDVEFLNPFPPDPDFVDEQYRYPAIVGIVPFLSFSDGRQPNRRVSTRSDRVELGYHLQFRPGSELIVVASGQSRDQVVDFVFDNGSRDYSNVAERLYPTRISTLNPNLALQAAHYLKVSSFQFRYGFDIFEGRFRERITNNLFDFCQNGVQYPCFLPIDQRVPPDPKVFPGVAGGFYENFFSHDRKKVRGKTVFGEADYIVGRKLTLTGGLTYDWANDDNTFIGPDTIVGPGGQRGVDRSVSHWNPRFGVLFDPTERTSLRFSAARSMQPLVSGTPGGAFARERLVPVHIYGFPVYRNELELTRTTGYDIGWDQRFFERSFLRTTLYWRERAIPGSRTERSRPGSNVFYTVPFQYEGDSYGGALAWNQFLTDRLTIVGGYGLGQENDLSGFRRDHVASARLFFIDSRGISAFAAENYLHQTACATGQACNAADPGSFIRAKAFTTDLGASYELPRKAGLLRFTIENVFDRRYDFLVDPFALDERIPRRRMRLDLQLYF